MVKTTTVRISIKSSVVANALLETVNEARKGKNKDELSKSQLIAFAIESLTVKMGVNK